jgi:YD repeat-containing protein
MPRPYNGAAYEQIRTFAWNGNVMTSETNPETGTISYQYDRAGRMTARIDAKHQKRGFEYDQYGRLSAKRYYKCDASNNNCAEETTQRVDYYYDYNPFDGSYSQNAWGRVAAVDFRVPAIANGPTMPMRYQYSYNQAGRVTNQRMQIVSLTDWSTPKTANLEAVYTWDNEGRMTSQQGPAGGPLETSSYDAMGRLSTGGATYSAAGELLTFNGVTRTYNGLGQLTRMTKAGVMDVEYIYTAGQNNGRIARSKDNVTGEDVTYQYDSLNRLMHAETADSLWGTTYTYDGWGNLTGKATTKGTAPTFSQAYDPSLNMPVGSNPPSYVPTGYSYDIEDRPQNGNAEYTRDWNNQLYSGALGYDPSGKKVFWGRGDNGSGHSDPGSCEIYFYSITGQRMASFWGKYEWDDNGPLGLGIWLKRRKTHVGGQLTAEAESNDPYAGGASYEITTDRLGSVRARGAVHVLPVWGGSDVDGVEWDVRGAGKSVEDVRFQCGPVRPAGSAGAIGGEAGGSGELESVCLCAGRPGELPGSVGPVSAGLRRGRR